MEPKEPSPEENISQREMARRGGIARARKLKPERRAQIAAFAGRASAKKRKSRSKTKSK